MTGMHEHHVVPYHTRRGWFRAVTYLAKPRKISLIMSHKTNGTLTVQWTSMTNFHESKQGQLE